MCIHVYNTCCVTFVYHQNLCRICALWSMTAAAISSSNKRWIGSQRANTATTTVDSWLTLTPPTKAASWRWWFSLLVKPVRAIYSVQKSIFFSLNLIHMGHQCTSNNVNTKEKCYLFDDETVENSTAFYEFGDQCHEMVLGYTAYKMSIDEWNC